jgi:hypothetical protein
MRLVVQVGPDHGRLRPISACQHRPVVDPSPLGNAIRIPELALRISGRPVAVENDDETSTTRSVDDVVHHLEAAPTFEVCILCEIDGGGHAGGLQQLVAERKADRVEAGGNDLVEHVLPISGPQAMRRKDRSLETEPVHARQANFDAAGVDEPSPFGADRSASRRRRPGRATVGARRGLAAGKQLR